MIINKIILYDPKRFSRLICGIVFILLSNLPVFGQEDPPRPISVTISLEEGINFGEFFHGDSGGTVVITAEGSRYSNGDVYLLGFTGSPVIILVEAIPGTIISMLPVPEVTLTGGGATLKLNLGDSYPTLPFVATTIQTQVKIGGTLTVGNSLVNPPGAYSGSFLITFNQE